MGSKLPREVSQSIDIAEKIVRSQGTLFIKELLRTKRRTEPSIRIGVTKEDVLQNLIAAITAEQITRADLESWIHDVEGWGRQHVYLYHVSPKLAKDTLWKSTGAVAERVRKHGRTELGTGEGLDPNFPEALTLSSVTYVDGALELIWRKGVERWFRDESKDKRREIDGDIYEFRAYRLQPNRAVMRFVLNPATSHAAVFVQVPASDPLHAGARAVVKAAVDAMIGWKELKPVDVSAVIKAFDQVELDAAGTADSSAIVAQHTKFAADGASVLFEAEPGNSQWKNNAAVRRVRRALNTSDFTGHSATFQLRLNSSEGLQRVVAMSLNGKERRIYLHAQMTVDEVWRVLEEILQHSI